MNAGELLPCKVGKYGSFSVWSEPNRGIASGAKVLFSLFAKDRPLVVFLGKTSLDTEVGICWFWVLTEQGLGWMRETCFE